MKEKFLTENYNRLYSSIIIDICLSQKITNFYTSPGMRNIPLLSALLNRKDEVNIFSAIDERASAYRALGNSKASQTPSVLICTSGSALANYLPAVIEANKTQTPLIIISANRPFEMSYSGSNQTIIQDKIFEPFAEDTLTIQIGRNLESPKVFSNIINHFLKKTQNENKKIVHLDIAFNEPLDETKQKIPEQILLELEDLSYFKTIKNTISYSPHIVDYLSNIIRTNKVLVVFGNLTYQEDQSELREFIDLIEEHNNYIYLDITSSLKLYSSISKNLIPSFDHPEVVNIFEQDLPSTIIHIGKNVTSKFYYQFLQKHKDIKLININNYDELQDPSNRQDTFIKVNPFQLIKELNKKIQRSNHKIKTNPLSHSYQELILKKSDIIDQAPLTYPAISKYFMEKASSGDHFFIANSTIIRSFDNYSPLDNSEKRDLSIHTNRGASGIEGIIATSVGICDHLNKKLNLFIGDISFLYDLNSLLLLKDANLNIFICNNNSGGIFSLLPMARDEEVTNLIMTPHEINFSAAAKLFDLSYHLITNIKQLDYKICGFKETGVNIIELKINNDENIKIYNQLKTLKL